MDVIYQIGQVSKLTKISTRMLRYYDTENILKPSLVETNGYRMYSDDDIKGIIKIKQLRKYHFSYHEIKEIMDAHQENNKAIYLKKLQELKNTVDDYDFLIFELEHIQDISNITKIQNVYDIGIIEKKSFKGLCKKSIVREKDLECFIEQCTQKTLKAKNALLGNFFIIFHTNPDVAEAHYEVEYCQPIAGDITYGDCELKLFDETLCISTIHYGDYRTMHEAYSALFQWAERNQFEVKGNFMEKYYVDASFTPYTDEFITEITIAVSK